jgi:hypothetical protein
MVHSGISVNDECKFAFKTMSKRSNSYVVFSIKNNPASSKQEIMLEDVCHEDADHTEFLEQLPENENRFAVVRVFYETFSQTGRSEGMRSKSIFVHWCPSAASVKTKFTYAASKQALKNKFRGGICTEIETGSRADLSHENLIEKCISVNY